MPMLLPTSLTAHGVAHRGRRHAGSCCARRLCRGTRHWARTSCCYRPPAQASTSFPASKRAARVQGALVGPARRRALRRSCDGHFLARRHVDPWPLVVDGRSLDAVLHRHAHRLRLRAGSRRSPAVAERIHQSRDVFILKQVSFPGAGRPGDRGVLICCRPRNVRRRIAIAWLRHSRIGC